MRPAKADHGQALDLGSFVLCPLHTECCVPNSVTGTVTLLHAGDLGEVQCPEGDKLRQS